MSSKEELLEQLRIDRTASARQPAGWRRRGWLVGISILIVAVAGAAILVAFAPGSQSVHAAVAKRVLAGTRAGATLLEASGYVVALREASVSGKSIYKVEEVLVQEGQPVKAGQVMARLDDSNTRAALEHSKAQVKQLAAALAAARVAAADARPLFVRNQKQLAQGLISQDTFDTSKASYDALETAVSVAEQNLAVARATVEVNQRYEDDTIIRAPFDGVVTVKTAQPGEIVSPQFSGGGGIAKIVDMDSLEVDVDVSENYINRVQPLQRAAVTLNAYPDWQIPAEVIAIVPTADRSKATVKVRVGLKVKDPRIVPEMGARVAFLGGAAGTRAAAAPATQEVLVPPDAVQVAGNTGNTATVFVIVDNRLERRNVPLGARIPDGQILLSGVEPGARLVVGDLNGLRDGARVHVEPY
jgi:RND family efflux transporter MFP subunit